MLDFKLNGADVSVDAPSEASLLFVLTNDLDMHGLKFGCGKSQCGACTVHIDGESVRSCVTQAQAAVGRSVTTLAGLLENGKPNKLQQAFIDINPKPTESEVRDALDGNLCRCGTHNRIVRAVLRATKEA